jgi:hypothetical protein
MRAFLAAFSLFWMVFFFGFKVAQDYGLDQCKKAGWAFIEERVFPKRAAKESVFGEEYAMKQLKSLQSDIATKCILRFR